MDRRRRADRIGREASGDRVAVRRDDVGRIGLAANIAEIMLVQNVRPIELDVRAAQAELIELVARVEIDDGIGLGDLVVDIGRIPIADAL